MPTLQFPYGRGRQSCYIPDARLHGVLSSKAHKYKPAGGQVELVKAALERPIGSPRLAELAARAGRVLIITSDHTRPVPSLVTMPLLLEELRRGNPSAEIKILIATGCHRAMTREEISERFGPELLARETFVNHDARAEAGLVDKGRLPSGGALRLNALVDWAELVVAEGFIEPHFFAGFSGGRKAILPGIAAERTVLANHSADFIAHPEARTGRLAGNPIHTDMIHAARTAGLAFILNVVIDAEKRIVAAFAGDFEKAHAAGCALVADLARVKPVKARLALTSNGGHPLDQNVYQAVKCMTAAEACLETGGVMVALAACADGHGGDDFYRYFAGRRDAGQVEREILAVPPERTRPDQWQAQILARILKRFTVILVAERGVAELAADMGMIYAPDLASALELAEARTGREAPVVAIPDGVAVIVE